ncbi:MAG: hypothetical protein RJA98_2497 [Pseudomonadota bacterium]|jgi:hypothetical protein
MCTPTRSAATLIAAPLTQPAAAAPAAPFSPLAPPALALPNGLSLPRPHAAAAPHTGSRRKRLWELDSHAHCPVIGVCLPIHTLRRVLAKVLGGQAVAVDYEVHCGAVAEARVRSVVSEAIQRDLDQRYAQALRQAAKLKTTAAVSDGWNAARHGADWAGTFWATLTHPRCDDALAHRVLGEVHMLQHQVGIARSVDSAEFDALRTEHQALQRHCNEQQQRLTRLSAEHALHSEQQQSQLLQARAHLLGRDTRIAMLHEQLQQLEAATPGLRRRVELAHDTERLLARVRELERDAHLARTEAERQRERAEASDSALRHARLQRAPDAHVAAPANEDATAPQARLDDQAVLCVGGRPSCVPLYRLIVERTGGRFLHHDGGEEESTARLEATLAAADVVICQTGCISHNAYWRVKDHCKRTGKRCVYVESPSTAGIRRALVSLAPAA